MPREPEPAEDLEPGEIPGLPRPRARDRLVGHAEAERAFADAIASGRLHHAWLIGGPRGIGKATLAYRVARFLLAGRGTADGAARDETRGGGGLALDDARPADRLAARQVAALSHPNLAVLRRVRNPERKTVPTAISVEAVRRALALFGSTAADSGYRICIVDPAEELSIAAANALLKVIEEPPPRSLFLIVSHAPQRLLPTIRSRCRRLTLRPLSQPELAAVVASLGPPWNEADAAALARAGARAEGSVARALELLDPAAAALVTEVETLVGGLWTGAARLDGRRVLALAERLAPREADALFALCLDTVQGLVSERLGARAGEPADRLAGLVAVCDKVAVASREAATYNLDRRPLVLSLFGDLAEAAR
jgi:DNA polymerase III subunit delta'